MGVGICAESAPMFFAISLSIMLAEAAALIYVIGRNVSLIDSKCLPKTPGTNFITASSRRLLAGQAEVPGRDAPRQSKTLLPFETKNSQQCSPAQAKDLASDWSRNGYHYVMRAYENVIPTIKQIIHSLLEMVHR